MNLIVRLFESYDQLPETSPRAPLLTEAARSGLFSEREWLRIPDVAAVRRAQPAVPVRGRSSRQRAAAPGADALYPGLTPRSAGRTVASIGHMENYAGGADFAPESGLDRQGVLKQLFESMRGCPGRACSPLVDVVRLWPF